MSYTQFEYGDLSLSKTNYKSDEQIEVSVRVTNTGKVDGEEVVQLYITDEYASVTRPVKELKDFKKVFIKAGETKSINFIITPDKLSFYDIDMEKIVEPGRFEIMIGGSSENLIKREIILVE